MKNTENYLVQPTFQFKRKSKCGKNLFAINRHNFPPSLTVTPLKSVTAAPKIYHKL